MADYLRRSDGRLEQVCEHGVGHTVAVDRVVYKEKDGTVSYSWWIHGCDGCCKDYERFGDAGNPV